MNKFDSAFKEGVKNKNPMRLSAVHTRVNCKKYKNRNASEKFTAGM